jgi:thioredoxin 1
VVLEFTATWSEPCKYMRPAVAEIAARFKDHAEFYTLDVDKFKVTSI